MTRHASLASLALTCTALVSLALPGTAAASSAVLLPRAGGSGVGPEARDAALADLRTVMRNDGWVIFTTAEVSLELDARLSSCGPDDECSHELRAMMDVDVAVGLRLWGTEDAIERLAVVLVGARGVGSRAVVEVDEDLPVPFAVAEAFRAAASQWSTGRVRGAWAPPPSEPAPMTQASMEPTALSWFLGGLFVIGSAPMLGYGINTAVRDGECVTEGRGGTCTERIRFREGAAIFTTLGAITLVAGVTIWILQPFRVAVRADSESASLHVAGSF